MIKIYKIKTMIDYAGFIERNIVYDNGRNIILQQWEKDVIEKVCGNEQINKVWILTGRKRGSTSLCKLLHWLRPECKETYLFSHSLDHSKYIANNKFIVNCVKFNGSNWLMPTTLNKFVEDAEVRDYLSAQMEELGMMDKLQYHFMYDSDRFDSITYKILSTYNYKLFTICIPYWEYNKVKDILNEDREKDNVVIVCDPDLPLFNGMTKLEDEDFYRQRYTSNEKIYKL